MAIGNPFKRPGDAELEKMGKSAWPDSSSSKVPPDSSLTSAGGGGFGKAARDTVEARQRAAADKQAEAEPPPEVDDYGKAAPSDSAEKKSEAVLSDPKWTESDTLFQQEAEVSVKVDLPEGKEHLTRIQAELFAKTANGRESISKAEGHADSSGRAAIVLPVYKPQGHKDGVVEYFVEFVHKLAKAMTTENLMRKVSETALKSADHVLVPGVSFPKDSSFIGPQAADGFRKVESKLKEWDAKDSKKAKVVVFGHADLDEKNSKALSERRAQSAYAFITNDSAVWEKLYGIEKWGLSTLQTILKDLGHYHGTPDGKDGLKTQEALKAIQNKTGLPATGKEDSATRQAMFSAYMKGKHDIKIEASRFRQVAGNPWMGCASNNHAKEGDEPAPENRRVAFILIKESKFFPVHFPCQDASEAACQGQCKKGGKRSAPRIRCAFYDELVRETQQIQSQNPDDAVQEEKPEAKGFLTAEEGLKIVSAAKTWVGTPYVTGGNTKKGADCSGSVFGIYSEAGYAFPRVSSYDFPNLAQFRPAPENMPQSGDVGYWPGHLMIFDHDAGITPKGEQANGWSATHPDGKPFGVARHQWFDEHYNTQVVWYRFFK
jgi:outer membrane protein OmpA-like peptidoglycan-associated protein